MLSRYRDTVRTWTDPIGRALFRMRLRPNHLTLLGLGVSLLAAAAFVSGHTRLGGVLLLLAGLFDFFDGALARVSGQVTPFGAFLDSVIDRYSDIVVLLGIVVFFAGMPHARGALVAMAGLVGSVMVSYTKARAESIGVSCNVGVMERPERMICLIAGALLDLLEPALWVLAVLANVTALQRIAFTRRVSRDTTAVRALLCAGLALVPATVAAEPAVSDEVVRSWSRAVEASQGGVTGPLVKEFSAEAALGSPIGDYVRSLLAEALARRGDLAAARRLALSVADRYRDGRLAPRALLMAATLAAASGDDEASQKILVRLLDAYPEAQVAPAALYLLGMTAEARGQLETAALAYRELTILAPTTGWADGGADRLAALDTAGIRLPRLSLTQRIDRAERLLRGGVPRTAADEAERIASESRDPSIALRALKVMAAGAQKLGRHEMAARALGLAVGRAPAELRPGLRLEQARLLAQAGQRERAVTLLATVAASGADAEAAEALYRRARLLEELERFGDAAAAYTSVADRFPSREVAGASLWRLGWAAYTKGDARAAERRWARLAELPGGRAYRIAGLYWAGRARERGGGLGAGARQFAAVLAEAPRSYYGMLAARRSSGGVQAAASVPVTLPENPDDAIVNDPGYVRVALLRRIGLIEDALAELEDVVHRSVGDTVRLYGFSGAYVKEERYHMALRIVRRHFAALAASGHPALPRAFWEILYPLGWRADLTQAAARAGLDPYLVAAVVREESSYHPRALSRAGARGLMQVMPATAGRMGRGEGLDDPRANLEIGTAFLAGLLKQFGDPRLALAAYNAGPRRLRDWWKARKGDDVEAFVELIPYDETRQYVKRVMLSWDEYRRIYGAASATADRPTSR